MKHAFTTVLVSIGALLLLSVIFLLALLETIVRGRHIFYRGLDYGLDEEET